MIIRLGHAFLLALTALCLLHDLLDGAARSHVLEHFTSHFKTRVSAQMALGSAPTRKARAAHPAAPWFLHPVVHNLDMLSAL